MSRRCAEACIDLQALQHNFQRVKQYAPASRIMAVIKADAYGHGMISVAQTLNRADGLAVAHISEAIALREAGIDKPIMVFQGFQNADQLAQMVAMNLWPTIHQRWQMDMLEQQRPGNISVWLKVNTGMGRIGVQPDEVAELWTRLKQNRDVKEQVLSSHFANADRPEHPSNQQQIDCFQHLTTQLRAQSSMANSAGLISFPDVQADWVRPGIMLYGASPIPQKSAQSFDLKPVMQLKTQIIAVNHLKKGDSVGYGSLWQCPEDMPVGIAAIGYGDGYPGRAKLTTPVSVNNQLTQLIGRVSMDMISIDLRPVKNAQPGDEVELWGKQITVDEVARSAETIAHELLCNVAGCRND